MELDKVTRVEVIDHTNPDRPSARAYYFRDRGVDVQINIQDGGKTLKVFLKKKNE